MNDGSKVMQAKRELDAAFERYEREIKVALQEELPIGAKVSWKHGQHRVQGVITLHGYSDRVQAMNEKTNAKTWHQAWEFTRRPQ